MMRRKEAQAPIQEKVLDVTASMQGQISFQDPVDLHIQGTFEGKLYTKGKLTVGRTAQVKAEIEGDTITIAGKVNGKVIARELLKITSTGECSGEIQTAKLSVEEGGILHGHCEMVHEASTPSAWKMSAEEAAQYLEIDVATITEWAMAGKIPAIGEDGGWKFDKAALEQWVNQQKLNPDLHR
ncbi:MAG: polymer-forming cytoskeletal protein [Candidatus Omnitrophica bacterium]|nr:polymer-forming cytoskeletal protein [Candidatus Omnitrophota bacterium]